jgi:hypothetical protein
MIADQFDEIRRRLREIWQEEKRAPVDLGEVLQRQSQDRREPDPQYFREHAIFASSYVGERVQWSAISEPLSFDGLEAARQALSRSFETDAYQRAVRARAESCWFVER